MIMAPSDANSATSIAVRAPKISRDSTQRPRLSVPNG